ncbi:MAG: phosphotransferase family protein [Rhodomicrobium sp.]|nr:phosphotransferase family protein [Rhodomicrobium sp.]
MSLDAAAIASIETYLARAFEAGGVRVTGRRQLSGGAIQENWAIDLAVEGGPRTGNHALVLRTDSPSAVAVSHSRAEEFQLLQAAWERGVTVPEPILCCTDLAVIGKPFCLMRRVAGTAVGQKVVKDRALGGDREALTERLGRELAKIHGITPQTHRFDFLPEPDSRPSLGELNKMRDYLDAMGRPRPALEWGMRWLELRAPASDEIVLAHHDFRTGNYMIDENGLTAILDWEFAGWSDPHEDIGWFCAMCWRFSERGKEAGGIGSRAAFYRGYEGESGRRIDPAKVYWWEVFAHLRWAVIALQQGERYLTGGERTLNLGLTALRTVEMEAEMLLMTAPGAHPKEAAR